MTTRAMFAGYDASGNTNLWVTDGTAAGTSELTAVGAASGLNPSGITVLGTKALFQGIDASSRVGLWVSDGTSGGTTELIPAGAWSGGLFGSTLVTVDLTVFGKKALFSGYDAAVNDSLWVTDGTSAGTSELAVAGADPGRGLFGGGGEYGPEFTVLGGKALFQGGDASLHANLWVTDGTSAGTSELNVVGANPLGLFVEGPGGVLGVHNPGFAVLGGRVIFNGSDAGGRDNLWVTDGTLAGTSQLTFAGSGGLFAGNFDGFAVLGSKAFFAGVNNLWVTDGTSAGTRELTIAAPYDITVFGAKALGADLAGHLWVSDGTSAGTSELAGPSFRDSLGQPVIPNFIAFGDKALFSGFDASGNPGLWVTDGTAAGTNELTVKDADVDGLGAQNFAVVGTKVLFEGRDKTGAQQLWVTDGSSAGTNELTVSGAYANGLAPFDITPLSQPPITIATNGVTALVQVAGQYELEAVTSGTGPFLKYNGSTVTVAEFPGWTPVGAEKTATGYEVAWSLGANEYKVWNTDSNGAYTGDATGVLSGASNALQQLESSFGEDLNGDGTIGPTSTKPPATDSILWRNSNGDVELWSANGSGGFTGQDLGVVGSTWQIAGTGDFNGSGEAGILWRNTNGDTALWNSNGSGRFTFQDLGFVGTSWQVAGTGDFNGAGEDILWRNSSGDTALWNPNGSGGFSFQDLGVVPTSWQIAGTGDFTGTGEDSILWRNSNGDTELWNPNGSGGVVGEDLGVVPTSWQIAGTGDFTGTGEDSILWRNTNGDTELWNPNGLGGFAGKDLGVAPTSWQVAGTGNFGGSGDSGILWRNSNGDTALWNPNGSGGFTFQDLGVVGGGWSVHKAFA